MKLLKPCGAILLPLALIACKTPANPAIADTSCLSFKVIRYSIPPAQPDGMRNVARDDGNKLDTPATVADLQEHNARWRSICERN